MRHSLPIALCVTPLVLATAVMTATVLGEVTGRTPFSDGGPRNSAEAAAVGDAAVLLRLLRSGESPLRVHRLRPEIISSDVQFATTLEAAVWSRRIEMIRLLDREGVIVGRETRGGLACLAADLDLPDVMAYLAPDGVQCVPGEASARVVARTR